MSLDVFVHTVSDNTSMWETIVHYIPIVSGIGLFIGGISAAIAFIFGTFIQRRDSWANNFREIYSEFWDDDSVTAARLMIVSLTQYNNILKPILIKRNADSDNLLTRDENVIIEQIDRFCAIMVRIASFSRTIVRAYELELWDKLFFEFWKNKVRPRNELKTYIDNHWPEPCHPSVSVTLC